MSKDQPPIVAASVLAADFGRLAEEIRDVESAGADWLHIDVMDGTFVPPISFGDNMISYAKKRSKLFLDVHLMIVNPEKHLNAFKQAGAERIIIHQEVSPQAHKTLSSIRALGLKNGIAINPGTPVSVLEELVEVSDLLLIMTVNPGWGGQPFIDSCLSKVEAAKELITKQGLNALIEVDGGINANTAKLCINAGADVLVAGSYIFGAANKADAIKQLR